MTGPLRRALPVLLCFTACARVGEKPFLTLYPHGGDATSPLIIALHGRADTPEHFSRLFAEYPGKAEIAVPRGLEPKGFGYQWFEWDEPTTEAQLVKNTDDAERKLWALIQDEAHSRKPVIIGFSQGATLAYLLAARHPDDLTASFPIGGRVPMPQWARGQRTAPLYPVHGTADRRVDIEYGRQTAKGFNVALREFDGAGHEINGPMRAELFARVVELLK